MKTMCFATAVMTTVVLGATQVTRAQETRPVSHRSVGAFWTANFASVSLAPRVDGVSGRQWIGGGVSADMALGEVWSIDARAFWNRRGARLAIAGTTGFQEVSADYISFPLLLKAARPGNVRPYVLGGVELGVKTGARVRTVVGAVDVKEDASSLIGRTDVALDTGAGVERAVGRTSVFVEGLYSLGLKSVTPEDSGDATRTRTLTLLAGVRF